MARIFQSKLFFLILGLVLGALTILAIRFVTYAPTGTHYHANFAVFINGERELFKGDKYYEETAANGCSINPVADPIERSHMHGGVNDVIHVHDQLVTWANFFENIKWGLGDAYLKTRDAIYTPDADKSLTFILNGKTVDSIAGSIIGDEDRLLISYGNANEAELQGQYDTVARTAHDVDIAKDPASCSAGDQVVTFEDRLNHLLK